ncbi:MAG: hypothetical protein C0601_11710 [Candidatus Muiribacterium halophilum]|uniref:Uncharacterized protein n=1 Tax=Muiribacterium halophilum TaxID=2053465 RepID=A0A2N5ZBI5_MUIH1|nr:MAG: hypothetical protein C0601_11710 [Candidatus Muirbacterium halophilum]
MTTPPVQNDSANEVKSQTKDNARYILKFTFTEVSGEFKGALVIIGDTSENKFQDVQCAIDKQIGLSTEDKVGRYLEIIDGAKKILDDKGSAYLVYVRKIENYFSKSLSATKIDKINKVILTTSDELLRSVIIKNMLDNELRSLISQGFEIDVEMKMDVDYYSEVIDEIKAMDDNNENDNNQESGEEKDPKNEVLIDVIPLIDPNDGVNANDVKPGDKVIVRITDDSVIGKHIAKSITGADNPAEVPVKTKVIRKENKVISKFRESSEVVEMKVSLADGVFGNMVVQKEVKLRNKSEDEKLGTEEKQDEQPEFYSEDDKENYIIYAGMIIFLALFIFSLIKYLG